MSFTPALRLSGGGYINLHHFFVFFFSLPIIPLLLSLSPLPPQGGEIKVNKKFSMILRGSTIIHEKKNLKKIEGFQVPMYTIYNSCKSFGGQDHLRVGLEDLKKLNEERK